MIDRVMLSTAYLPPVEYFHHIYHASHILIEKEENYQKQTYRNRCYILAANGCMPLSIPVLQHKNCKTVIKDVKIDYSKRWQQVHLRAITSAYGSSPFYMYYYDELKNIINSRYDYLIDLNNDLLNMIMRLLNVSRDISYTDLFVSPNTVQNDHRYDISPKKVSSYTCRQYTRVFNHNDSHPQPSIIDLLFNTGPEATAYLN